MDQGTEPVKVHAFEGVGRETHHTLLFFALLVMRARSYRYAENSVSFFSVAAHLLHSEISRAAGFPALLSAAPQRHPAPPLGGDSPVIVEPAPVPGHPGTGLKGRGAR
jgi:hypothetical protein